jgi:hypothetical protein
MKSKPAVDESSNLVSVTSGKTGTSSEEQESKGMIS